MSDIDASDGGEEDQYIAQESFNITKICSLVCNNETTFSFLADIGAVKSAQRCSNSSCRRQMKIARNSAKRDGARWTCSACHT